MICLHLVHAQNVKILTKERSSDNAVISPEHAAPLFHQELLATGRDYRLTAVDWLSAPHQTRQLFSSMSVLQKQDALERQRCMRW